jgi:hypothetical protein
MKLKLSKTGRKGCISRISAGAFAVFFISTGVRAQQAPVVINFSTITNAASAAVLSFPKPPMLDAQRLFALGMIETGNDDREVGAAGEVSRYQIHPTVWKAYSPKADYQNTQAAVRVAQQHWTWLAGYFMEKAGRQPTDFDMYVLWNTKFGYYARRGFVPKRLAAVVRDRAERFVNLVNRKG